MIRRSISLLIPTLVTVFALLGCRSQSLDREPTMLRLEPPDIAQLQEISPRCEGYSSEKKALFGDLHVHTAYSLDANLRGTRVSPLDAYRFATGERIPIPPFGPEDDRKLYLQLDRPLDFAAVTDHAEFLGLVSMCENENSIAFDRAGCKMYRSDPDTAFLTMNARLAGSEGWRRRPQICGPGDEDYCREARLSMWHDIQAVAERFYDRDPSCDFTTFVGYEWTASPNRSGSRANNMHRNILFANANVTALPLDYFDYPTVDSLHAALRVQCRNARNACDVLAIPHNSNLSGGLMFPEHDSLGQPFSRDYAERRASMEPLFELYQHKGASECFAGALSGDEYCGFETLPFNSIGDTVLNRPETPDPTNFVRHAFSIGLKADDSIGSNPYAYGLIASTDNHLALAGGVDEKTFAGGGGAQSLGYGRALPDSAYFSGGGLVGVWAEENSRPAIFSAMQRREVFGTSGPRITPRVYAGWDVPDDLCNSGDVDWDSLSGGAVMGGEITAEELRGKDEPPTFYVEASWDPGVPDNPGARLERVQMIKGWVREDGETETKVVDVATADMSEAAETRETCATPSVGSETLCATFTDPEWRADQHAYYYFRVLQVPTCRWTTAQCVAADYDCEHGDRDIDEACCREELGLHEPNCLNVDCPLEADAHPECCTPGVVQPMIRERAWTSPIWIRPSTENR
jgi:hypothetical protein